MWAQINVCCIVCMQCVPVKTGRPTIPTGRRAVTLVDIAQKIVYRGDPVEYVFCISPLRRVFQRGECNLSFSAADVPRTGSCCAADPTIVWWRLLKPYHLVFSLLQVIVICKFSNFKSLLLYVCVTSCLWRHCGFYRLSWYLVLCVLATDKAVDL